MAKRRRSPSAVRYLIWKETHCSRFQFLVRRLHAALPDRRLHRFALRRQLRRQRRQRCKVARQVLTLIPFQPYHAIHLQVLVCHRRLHTMATIALLKRVVLPGDGYVSNRGGPGMNATHTTPNIIFDAVQGTENIVSEEGSPRNIHLCTGNRQLNDTL